MDHTPLAALETDIIDSSPRPDTDSMSISDRGSSVFEQPGRMSDQSLRHDLDPEGKRTSQLHDADEVEEEEELLEEIADEQDIGIEADSLAQHTGIPVLVLATQAAAMTALQTLLRQMQHSQQPPAANEEHAIPSLLDNIEAALSDVSTTDSRLDRQEAFTKVNSLLDSLASDALVAGSSGIKNEGVNLATALGDLLLSLEKVRATSDSPHTYHHTRKRTSSVSTTATTSSSGREDLKNPFADASPSDVFQNLHRLSTLLYAKTTCPSPSASARTSFQSTFSAPNGDHHTFPRRFDSLDIPHSHLRTGSSSSLGHASHMSPSSLSLASTAALRLHADPEAWSHVGHILSLTRDLVASSQLHHQQQPASPMLARSRHGSNASSNNPDTGGAEAGSASADARSGTLARRSFNNNTTVTPRAGILKKRGSMGSLTTSSLGHHSLPPRYSDDEIRRDFCATDSQIRDYQARGLLPAYAGLDEKGSPLTSQRAWPEKGILIKSSNASMASDASAQTPSEFHAIQNTLDRLAPQLTDQRVSPVVRKRQDSVGTSSRSRESNLQDLIDQLSSSGRRLDDQRVEAPPPLPSTSATATAVQAAPAPLIDDEKGAVRPIASNKPSALRKFSSAQLAGFRKAASKGKERSHSPAMQQAPGSHPVSFPSFSDAGATPPASAPAVADRGLATSQKRGTTLRSRLFASGGNSEQRRSRSPKLGSKSVDAATLHSRTPSAQLDDLPSARSRYEEDNDLFDLLAATSNRSRFADQEFAMRPREPRRRHQSGGDLGESPIWQGGRQRDANQQRASTAFVSSSADTPFRSRPFAAGRRSGEAPLQDTPQQQAGPRDDDDEQHVTTDGRETNADDRVSEVDEEDFLQGAGRRTHQGSKKMEAILMAS